MDYKLISKVLARDEGKGKPGAPGKAYLDSAGIPPVGIGRNLKAVGLRPDELAAVLLADMAADELLETIADNDQIHMQKGRFTFDSLIAWEAVVEQPLTDAAMEFLLANDLDDAASECERVFINWHALPAYAREVLVQVMFNLGGGTFRKFRNMIAAILNLDFDKAAAELLDSRAARQTGQRYHRYAAVLTSGDTAGYEL